MKLIFDDIGKGPPIVLIHAFPFSKEMWKAQAESLVSNGFRVILPDLPGFGKSHSFSKAYPIEEMAAQIAEIFESLNIKEAIGGGLSMGGYVLFNLLRLIPEKLTSLIFCDTTFLADSEEKRNLRFELISKINNQGSVVLVEDMLPNIISDSTKKNNPELTNQLKDIFSKVNPASAINALRSMAERKDNSVIIRQISVPTLLMFGEFDKVTDLENAQKMHQMIPGSELAIIEKAGHLSNLEQPEKFNKVLLNFCNRINFNA